MIVSTMRLKKHICNKIIILGILSFTAILSGCGKDAKNVKAGINELCQEESIVAELSQEASVDVENTFKDNVLKNYILEYVDVNRDGALSSDEILEVTQININGFDKAKYKELTSLKGIDLFINLEELTCYGCELSEIDISKNIKLKKVSIGFTNIDKLDISNNKELEYLDCSNTNLNEIDLHNNVLIEYLWITDTNISVIDLSGLERLKVFSCAGTQVKDIDVKNNVNLNSIAIGDTEISSIDLSKNPELSCILCEDAKNLRNLDLSSNPKLSTIYCQRSGIKTLDLSNNHDIYEVECDKDTVIIGEEKLEYITRF